MRIKNRISFCSSVLVLVSGMTSSYVLASADAQPEGKVAETISKEDKEFREKSAKMAGYEVKIMEMNKSILELVEKKKKSRDVEVTRGYMKELVTLSEERNKMVKDYARLKQYLLYRFPSRGETLARRYGVHEEMSADQHEKASGIDNLLTEIKEMIQKKYAPIIEEERKKNGETEGAESMEAKDVPAVEKKKEEPLRLVK